MLIRTLAAYIASLAATYGLAVAFFTQQVIARQAVYGAVYTPAQQMETFFDNLSGLALSVPSYGMMIAIALAAGFGVAFGVKRLATPLAPVAYPVAGAASIALLVWLIEQQLGGGAGVIGGARDATGFALQALAGFLGGALFAVLRPR